MPRVYIGHFFFYAILPKTIAILETIVYTNITKNKIICLSPPYEMWRFFYYFSIKINILTKSLAFFVQLC